MDGFSAIYKNSGNKIVVKFLFFKYFFQISGRSYIITTPKSLSNILDSLVQKFQMGVVINFEKIGGPDKPAEGEDFSIYGLRNI